MKNTIFTLKPYKWNGTWVFDDPRVGLDKEAFVCGADAMIDVLLKAAAIWDAGRGFILQFSHQPFPDARVILYFSKHESKGTWYYAISPLDGSRINGWLCSALNLYYPRSPRRLYVAVKPLVRR